MTAAETWLRERLSDAPPRLLDAMVAAVRSAGAEAGVAVDPAASVDRDDGGVPDALAAAALMLYERVLAGSGKREDALPLLAADALMTHALEAQAEIDADGLAGFDERWGAAGKLGEMAARLPA
ncbi:MAG: hypothetical protein JWM27_1855 [Gemmatimonadetes bacterium]|nr:hypothetical protein [Gemmatimonadota bacterium]